MSEETDLQRFIGYVQAFELAQAADAWQVIEPFFAQNAVRVVHEGGPMVTDDQGREATLAGLRDAVLIQDRRFDVRIPEILEGPLARPDGIWMRYTLTLRRAPLPDLCIEGEHLTVYEDGLIARIEETVPTGTTEKVLAYLAEHDAALLPAGSPPTTPNERDLRDLKESTERSMVRAYGCAKSQQDVGAALKVCGDDFVLETPAFATRGKGKDEVAAQLAIFFEAFPDYNVELAGFAHGDMLATWGRVRLSLRGDLIGIEATNKTADLECMCLFQIENGVLRRERFIFDRADFCEQLGIPVADLDSARALVKRLENTDALL